MELTIYQIDAFTNKVFGGNSAAVCPLKEWLSDEVMQAIAMENAIAETAFIKPNKDGFDIRWFTPEIEMDLCGHATLAAAHVIKHHLKYSKSLILFDSKSGKLPVTWTDKIISLDFPSRMPIESTAPKAILNAFNIQPIEVFKSRDYMLIYENEEQIKNLQVNASTLDQINLGPGGVIVTAKGNNVDFVSRFFTPQASTIEDPVTGSAHCSLIPYWAKRLSKSEMTAKQLSARVGDLHCVNKGDRVIISGAAVTYLVGKINV